MNCEEVRDLLSAFQDRELEPGEMTAIEQHLSSCRECADKSHVLASLSRVIQHWEGVRASEETRHEVLSRAHTDSARLGGRRIGKGTLALLGLLAAALLGGGTLLLGLWYTGREPDAGGVPRRAVAGRCTSVTGRVELFQTSGAAINLDPGGLPAEISLGQELRCDTGAKAQVDSAGGSLVLAGEGALKFFPGEFRLKRGTLVFRLPAQPPSVAEKAARGVVITAGNWRVLADNAAVGLVELSKDDSVRLAVLKGSATLTGASGKGARQVMPGQEISVDADGGMTGPRAVADEREFDLLNKR